jgi:hypothetical protein
MVELIGRNDGGHCGQRKRSRPERMEPDRVADSAARKRVPGPCHATRGTRSAGEAAKRAQSRTVLENSGRHQHRSANREADRLPVSHVVRFSGSPFESGTLPSAIRMMSTRVQIPQRPSVMSFRMPRVV